VRAGVGGALPAGQVPWLLLRNRASARVRTERREKVRRFAIILSASALAAALSGCVGLVVGAGAGAGAYAYIEGNLKRNYEAALPRVWDASVAAMADLELKPSVEQHDAFTGMLRGRLADGREFTVKLARVADRETEVSVRVEILGDRKVSESIHDRIAAHLR
jgi:hypothetical protein